MYIRKQLKKRFIMSMVTVFILVITILGSSYALFMDIKTDVNDQVLSVGDLQVTFSGGKAIDINDLEPMTDVIAAQQSNNVYTFTIENVGTVPYSYNISLENNSDFAGLNLLNHNYIRLNFNNTGAKTLSSLPNGEVFEGNLSPGQSKLFNLRLWVADATVYNLPNSALGSQIHLNIIVDGKAGTE